MYQSRQNAFDDLTTIDDLLVSNMLRVAGLVVFESHFNVDSSLVHFTKTDHYLSDNSTPGTAAIENCSHNDALMILGRAGSLNPVTKHKTRMVRLRNWLHVEEGISTVSIHIATKLSVGNSSSTIIKDDNISCEELQAERIAIGPWTLRAEKENNSDLLAVYCNKSLICVFSPTRDRIKLFTDPKSSDSDIDLNKSSYYFCSNQMEYGIYDSSSSSVRSWKFDGLTYSCNP